MSSARSSSLRDYVQILRRRKWWALAVIVAIPAAAVAISLTQHASYRATAQVLLNRQDLSSALSGTPDTGSSQDPGRYASTQADLARVPTVAEAAISQSHVPVSLKSFLADSDVTSSPDSDLLEFGTNYRTPAGAEQLVDAYARAFVNYRRTLDTAALSRARADVATRLKSLPARGNSALRQSLASKADELRTLQAVQTPHAILVRTADGANQTQPKVVRNALVALVLAIGLGIGLAFLVQALDTRVGSAVDIAEALRLPLLGRLPVPPRHVTKQNGIVMLAEPHGVQAEAFRVLRTNLELVNIDRDARIVMVVSGESDEGKSTTIANLAVAAARAGRHVVLVDLDLRRGDLDGLLGQAGQPGVSEVAVGTVSLGAALLPIDVGGDATEERAGSLHLLPAGHLPPSAGELAASERVGELLAELSDQADLVLIDAPPFLHVGDAMALSARVDGVVVVTRLDVRRPVLDEIQRALEKFRALTLGAVVTGDQQKDNAYASYSRARSGGGGVAEPVA